MPKLEFWRTDTRPASFNPRMPIHERKPVYADDSAEARRLVDALPAVVVGNLAHKPALIEGLIPYAARA